VFRLLGKGKEQEKKKQQAVVVLDYLDFLVGDEDVQVEKVDGEVEVKGLVSDALCVTSERKVCVLVENSKEDLLVKV
jgi:hypothetical protein